MYKLIFFIFCVWMSVFCSRESKKICFPDSLTVTSSGQDIDSLIKSRKYTALVLYCDNCGKGISELYCWDGIIKKNPNISPLLIIKSKNPKLVEAYLDIYNVVYPRVNFDFDTIKVMNPCIKLSSNIVLIDSLYQIVHQSYGLNNTLSIWQYIYQYGE